MSDLINAEVAAILRGGTAYQTTNKDVLDGVLAEADSLALDTDLSALETAQSEVIEGVDARMTSAREKLAAFSAHTAKMRSELADRLVSFSCASTTAAETGHQEEGFGDPDAFFGSLMTEGSIKVAEVRLAMRNVVQVSNEVESSRAALSSSVADMRTTMESELQTAIEAADEVTEELRLQALKDTLADFGTLAPQTARETKIDEVLTELPDNASITSARTQLRDSVSGVSTQTNNLSAAFDNIESSVTSMDVMVAYEEARAARANAYLEEISDAMVLRSLIRDPLAARVLKRVSTDGFIGSLLRTDDEQ